MSQCRCLSFTSELVWLPQIEATGECVCVGHLVDGIQQLYKHSTAETWATNIRYAHHPRWSGYSTQWQLPAHICTHNYSLNFLYHIQTHMMYFPKGEERNAWRWTAAAVIGVSTVCADVMSTSSFNVCVGTTPLFSLTYDLHKARDVL